MNTSVFSQVRRNADFYIFLFITSWVFFLPRIDNGQILLIGGISYLSMHLGLLSLTFTCTHTTKFQRTPPFFSVPHSLCMNLLIMINTAAKKYLIEELNRYSR